MLSLGYACQGSGFASPPTKLSDARGLRILTWKFGSFEGSAASDCQDVLICLENTQLRWSNEIVTPSHGEIVTGRRLLEACGKP